MTAEPTSTVEKTHKPKAIYRGGAPDAIYGLGMIGAWIYFIGQATGFWVGVLGFFKGIVWPVFLVYELLRYLGM